MITRIWHVPCPLIGMMSYQGVNMVRKLLQAAAAALALAPIAAQATTLAFHFDTRDALLAQGDTAVGGLANGGKWSYDATLISTNSYADNPGVLFAPDAYDGAIDGAFDLFGRIRDLPSNGGLGSDKPGQVRSLNVPEAPTWLMLGLGFALLVGRRRSRQDRQAAVL
jgi:hypothetical protein